MLNLAILLFGSINVGIELGMLVPLYSLTQEAQGMSEDWIGISVSTSLLGALITGFFVPKIARKIGLVQAILVGIFGLCIVVLFSSTADDLGSWIVFRFLSGVCFTLPWFLGEIWLNQVVSDKIRGRIVGLYISGISIGMFIGPLLLSLIGLGQMAFYVGACVVASIAFFVILMHLRLPSQLKPDLEDPQRFMPIIRMAPFLMLIAIISGIAEEINWGLFPIWSQNMAFSTDQALILLSCFALGSPVFAFPVGWLADRMDRVVLLILCVLALGCLTLFLGAAAQNLPFYAFAGYVLVYGGMVLSLYHIGLALTGQRFVGAQLPHANTAFIMCYTFGGLIGPTLGGSAMHYFGTNGYIVVLSMSCFVFLILSVTKFWRATVKSIS